MAEYVVFCVIRSLSELLAYDARRTPELRSRIEVLRIKLSQLQSILEIADARQDFDEGIRNWIIETREAAYDIEDLLLQLLSSSSSSKRKHTNLESTIQQIEVKILALESDFRVRNVRPRWEAAPRRARRAQQQRRTYSHFVEAEEDLVGLDDHVEQLVARLVEEYQNQSDNESDDYYQAVSITGMGGIGKTTIAKRIYHHPSVRAHFHAFAWVCVSQQPHPEDVLHRILNKLEPAFDSCLSLLMETNSDNMSMIQL